VSRRILVLADTGGEQFHVGDEAMLDANLARLADELPDAELRVHGRGSTLTEIERAVRTVDGVLVSGGGNLSSTWPHLLDQRIVLLEAAAARGVPVVTGGQTIGPVIDEPRRSRLAAALATVAVLGVRERPSARLALDLGVPGVRLALQVDDAFWLEGTPPADPELLRLAEDGFVAVTLDGSYADERARTGLQSLAAQVVVLAGGLGLPVLAIPHVGRLGRQEGEDPDALGRFVRLAALAGARTHLAAVPTVAEAVWLHRRASLTVSSRYHPLVFGSAAGVPCVGVARDDYTAIKLGGALAHLGEDRWLQRTATAEAGGLLSMVSALLEDRAGDRPDRSEALRRLREQDDGRWRRLVDVLR
jgi:polysaccharide pyruvyl transferase WcaK-like protein